MDSSECTFLSVVLLVAPLTLSLSPLFTVFYEAESFNQPLGDWDVSRVSPSDFGLRLSECTFLSVVVLLLPR